MTRLDREDRQLLGLLGLSLCIAVAVAGFVAFASQLLEAWLP